MIDFTKPLRTRDGRKVRILCTDRRGDMSVVGLATRDGGGEIIMTWCSDGSYTDHICKHDCDLVNVNEGTFWVNVYDRGGPSHAHTTCEEADKWAAQGRLARIRVPWREGQFDE